MRTNLVTAQNDRRQGYRQGHRDQCQQCQRAIVLCQGHRDQCQQASRQGHRDECQRNKVGTQELEGARAHSNVATKISLVEGTPLTTKTGYPPGSITHHHRQPLKRAWPGRPLKWELGGKDNPYPLH